MHLISSRQKHIFYSRSGTHALVEGLKSFGFKKNSEILIPDFTCIWVPLACYFAGLKPRLVDINKYDYNINIKSLRESISNKSVGVIAVDSFGSKSSLKEVNKICKKYNLVHIRDLANGSFDKDSLNSVTDITVFSFGMKKFLECGGGGLLVSNNKKVVDYISLNKINKKRHFVFNAEKLISYSYNYFSAKLHKRNINIFNINNYMLRFLYYIFNDNIFPNYRISFAKKLKFNLQSFKKLREESYRNIKLYKTHLSHLNLNYQKVNNSESILRLNIEIPENRDIILDELNKIFPMPLQYIPLHIYLNKDSSQLKNSLLLSKKIINLPINYIDSETVVKLATRINELLK